MINLKSYGKFVNESKLTDDARDFISKKIAKLKEEGYEDEQAVAIAYSYAKKAGYDVPNANEGVVTKFTEWIDETAVGPVDDNAPVALDLEEYEDVVLKGLMEILPQRLMKYTGTTEDEIYKMITSDDQYTDHWDMTLQSCWENDIDPEDAIEKYREPIINLMSGQAGAM